MAKVIDVSQLSVLISCLHEQWHAGILAQQGGLDRLRASEKSAKEKRLGLWEGYGAAKGGSVGAATNGHANGTAMTSKGSAFDAIVVRVWGSDQLSVVPNNDESGKERRIQFASVRGPRGADGKQAYWANEAKEYVASVLDDYRADSSAQFLAKAVDWHSRSCLHRLCQA